MPPSTQNSAPTLGVDKKNVCSKNTPCFTRYWSLSICGLRDMGYAKVWKRKKNGHMKVQEEKEKK